MEWICFGSTTFDAVFPVYTNVPKIPKYLSNVTESPSTENFYWSSRLIGALADPNYASCIQPIERYQNAMFTRGHRIVLEYDRKMRESGDFSLAEEANSKLCHMAKEQTEKALFNVLYEASVRMKNGYNRADN